MKFYSERPHLYLAFRIIPNYPITSEKVLNNGIDFNGDGEFTTDDEVLIKCLKLFIEIRGDKSCPIWYEGMKGQEQYKHTVERVLEPVKVPCEDDFKEFARLLRF